MAMTSRVKRTLLRRSGTRKMLPRRASTALPVREGVAPGRWTARRVRQRDLLDRATRGRDRLPCRRREGVPAPEDLHERALPHEARVGELVGAEVRRADGVERVEVHRRVLDTEGIGEAAQLRDPLHERELPALEPCRDGVACPLPLGAPPSGLAALSCGAPPHPALGPPRAGGRRQIVQLHSVTSSTRTRWGTRASIPRISGRSGSSLDWPMPRSPRARRVPRCFGLEPISERTWVTRRTAILTAPVRRARTRACARGRRAARRSASPRREPCHAARRPRRAGAARGARQPWRARR